MSGQPDAGLPYEGLSGDRARSFARLIWRIASPNWEFDHATFDRSATAFDNPDHIDVMIRNYRWRIRVADGDSRCEHLERKLAAGPPLIAIPTITLEADASGAPHPNSSTYARKFVGRYAHRLINCGIGHNLPQEAPQAFIDAIVDVDSFG